MVPQYITWGNFKYSTFVKIIIMWSTLTEILSTRDLNIFQITDKQLLYEMAIDDYLNEVCEVLGIPDVKRRVIKGDYSGDAAKYLNTAYGTIEREEILWCYNHGCQVSTCVSSVITKTRVNVWEGMDISYFEF